MTVINPNSISGITSITLPSGDGNVLTIHTNDGTERFRIDSSGNVKVGSACTISQDGDVFFTGVTTATTFTGAHSGSGANLTSLPAGNLTGTLPAISGANLTGIAATDNVRTGILEVAGIATFSSDVKIGAAVTISESGIEASGIGITCANINGAQIGGRRNLIINGAMQVAQRGTTATGTNGFGSVDRFETTYSGTDEAPTQSQHTLSSSDDPYAEGFRYSYHVTNGNQTSGAGADDYIRLRYKMEAQDLANSGWNYTSSTNFVTLSYWIKASVSQTYYTQLRTQDGTDKKYIFEQALTANTWKKVVHSIPGASDIQFDLNNEEGFYIAWYPFRGTNNTGSLTLNQWQDWNSGSIVPDMTTTWYTTNDSTIEITGVQLELGSQATAFEHHTFSEELTFCHRYHIEDMAYMQWSGYAESGQTYYAWMNFPVKMRANPTCTATRTSESGFSSDVGSVGDINEEGCGMGLVCNSSTAGAYFYRRITASSEL